MNITKEKRYQKAHTELNEIIKSFSEEEKRKITLIFIKNLQNNMDINYIFELDMSKKLSEQNLMPETKALLVEIYERFLAPENEKELWEKYDRLCLEKIEKKKREMYSPDNLFKKDIIDELKSNNDDDVSLLCIKNENIFIRFINKLKQIFRKKK